MSSNTPLTDSINNLTDYINGVTSGSDTNLSDAVATLASGYGSGGGSQYATGTIIGTNEIYMSIPFGFVPDLIYIYQSDDTTLLKRIVEVFCVNGIGSSGLYMNNDTATTALKASLVSNPDITGTTGNIGYVYAASDHGCCARISSCQLASGVEYTWEAWKFNGGGGGISINDFIERSNVTGDIAYNGNVTTLPVGAYAETGITSFSSNTITDGNIGYQFWGCSSLKNVDLPNYSANTTASGIEMFRYCTSLETVNLPKFKRSGGNIFQGCSKLTMLVLPSVNYQLGNYFANNCTLLNTVDLGASMSGTLCGGNAFTGTALSTLILRRTSGVISTAANNFSSGATFTCYVPSALISSYQSASNWSNFNITWQSIEGSIYETKYADGTPIT